ncbi:hypothetical protein BC938DRAFT_475122 [Jimgerdemannia flammicorona]|uniref:CutA1 divalent ion tolerance protein n=1 Tax=Jimgerdemannia flammicorona TaxID=994334 RepID=A0A433Q0J7_9FUNG|nr:hypothetical protein BC938DRAFT_475122 [Jimgerdemannia flammicorona]
MARNGLGSNWIIFAWIFSSLYNFHPIYRATTMPPHTTGLPIRTPANVVFVNCPDEIIARDLAKGLLEERLVAFVNIFPGATSMYWSEGQIRVGQEALLKMNTLQTHVGELTDYVNKHHPGEVPAVVAVKIENGSRKYIDTIRENVKHIPGYHGID